MARPGSGQPAPPLWQPAAPPAARGADGKPEPGQWFTLDAAQLAARLAPAPPETRPADAVTLELPYPDGTLHRFAVTQVPVMAPALAARFPQIKTYAGRALDDPATTARLETSPAGLHAQVLAPGGPFSVVADPTAPRRYHSRLDAPGDFECLTEQLPGTTGRPTGGTPPLAPAPYGTQLRTLRLAMAATGEYVQRLGGGTVAGTLEAMVILVSSVNTVYERDLALRLVLVANNDRLIYLDPATDPYVSSDPTSDNNDPTVLLNANQGVVVGVLGAGSFDLGHVLGYRGGGYSGIAGIGAVCSATRAARGSSTGSSAELMATVLTHEIGHQLGSGHTFNGDQGNCGSNNRSPDLAYEPGAGNTIMSYDSRCDPDDVGGAIRYFHAGSLSAIVARLTCGSFTPTGNRAPIITVPPSTYTIPIGTPFTLAGTGTDPDGNALTYSWEQLDRGDASGLAGAAIDVSGPPLFRSFAPVPSPVRTFPMLLAVLSNSASLGEILPLVPRALNFRLTARDGLGGVAGANVALAVAAAGPFAVTAPAAAFTAAPGSTYPLTWSVLGTDQAPVSCANVQVLFSTDGGLTFPTVLLASTPNDGAAPVQLPNLNTTQGRLKIQALDNVFFAVNNANITLAGAPPLPVELTAFAAEARLATAHLTWTTASERNNAGFAVEASSDGTAFRRVGWVAGQGTSSRASTYQFDDALAAYPGPTVYYRLRQTDNNGTENFSPVRTVAVPTGLATQLRVWPSPARGTVSVAGLAPGQAVQLFDLTGRVLLTAALPASGPLQLVLPASLTPGIYVVRGAGQSRRLVVE
ncbi:reprolysin-like metallopeptidase [Hymenobacter sp.]|uniref:reprolysin-like metallopeptidase n=1 Tax=Hymenobacter sp. TaxID=1898978 RepID=UPI00286B4990|nr:zinc-dependent metalloprotease family protein [Hymenobacter sp.]